MQYAKCFLFPVAIWAAFNPSESRAHADFSGPYAPANWTLTAEDVAESVAFVVNTPPDVLVHSVEVRTLTVPKHKS